MDRWTFGTLATDRRYRLAATAAAALVASCLVASPAAAQRGGWEEGRDRGRGPDLVVLYSEPGFRGRSEAFRRDDGRLGDNRIGNDSVSSVEVPRGCRVTLYEHDDFRGRSVELDRDVADLGRTRIGNRRASSLRVSCGRPGGWPGDGGPGGDLRDGGVVLYEDEDYRGRSEFFEGDVADLRRTRIGSDRASSIRVGRGCRVTLYRDVDFRGRSAELDRDHPDLGRTPLGNDAASSLAVDCRRGGGWDDGGWDDRGGVTLYSEPYFRGARLGVDRDERSLGRTPIGNDRVRSVRVSRGCRATLYEDDDFRGRSVDLDRDAPSLEGAPVRPGEASSIRVRCRRPPAGGGSSGELPYGAGAVVYRDTFFRGEGIRIRGDIERLDRSPIGNDRASSIELARGCEAILFRDANFRDRGVRINRSVDDLGSVPGIGNDQLSSIQVRCDGRRGR